MPATYDAIRRLALALPGVEEGMAYGTPSLHIRCKLMARLREDGETVVVKIDPAERTSLIEREPDTFFITDHYRDHPVVLINLLSVRPEVLPTLIEGAWRQVTPKRLLAAWNRSDPAR